MENNEAKSAYLNSKLPIAVIPSELDEEPSIFNVLDQASAVINPTGLTHLTSSKLEQAKESLVQERVKYMKLKSLFEQHRNMEIEKGLIFGEKQQVTKQEVQRKANELSQYVTKLHKDVHSFISGGKKDNAVDDGPMWVAARQKDISKNKEKNAAAIKERHMEMIKCFGLLEETREAIEKILDRTMNRENLDKIQVEFELKKAEVLLAKFKACELDVLKEDYNQQGIKAHRAIRNQLKKETQDAKLKLDDMDAKLRVYQNLSPDFNDVLKRYVEAKTELDNRRWALNELTKGRNGSK